MKRKKKRPAMLIVCCLLAGIILTTSACRDHGQTENIVTEATEAKYTAPESEESTEELTETGKDETEYPDICEDGQPYPYLFNPHVMSEEYKDKYGEEIEQVFYAFCDAALAGEESFPCPDTETYIAVFEIARVCLPVAAAYTIIEEQQPQNGVGKISYTVPIDEYKEQVREFRERISWWLTCLREGDSPFERTVSIYTMMTNNLYYDYEALESSIGLSPYRALMGEKAICQEIAGAYVYLLLQADVNACLCGALSRDMSNAHEWVMVRLDGEYYHMDPTFELDTVVGLEYFGMTDKKREEEGDYPIEFFNVAEVNGLDQAAYSAENDRFAPLWNTSWYELDRERNVILYHPVDDIEQVLEFKYE